MVIGGGVVDGGGLVVDVGAGSVVVVVVDSRASGGTTSPLSCHSEKEATPTRTPPTNTPRKRVGDDTSDQGIGIREQSRASISASTESTHLLHIKGPWWRSLERKEFAT